MAYKKLSAQERKAGSDFWPEAHK